MKLGLGIDTGGTYTDAAIYDFESGRVVCRSKALTTKENLLTGIDHALSALEPSALSSVGLVSLSTTLATNACVEGRGSRAKLILMGCDPLVAEKYGAEYGLPPIGEILFVPGGHDVHGKVSAQPDWDALENAVRDCAQTADAFAVVELWGITNPEFEKKAREIIEQQTGRLVVCGHEITNVTNSLRRAASALLNAQLVGVINEFLDAVRTGMRQRNLRVPVAIVKSDGTMMSDAYARTRPVETLLCGPAASVCGGMFLTGREHCVVADMGGTTTDIAVVSGSSPLMTAGGADIGGWKTGIRSIDITTVGLGGDSIIRYDEYFRLSVGPTKATPLCCAAQRWPSVAEEIAALYRAKKKHTVSLCEFLYAVRPLPEGDYYSDTEREIVRTVSAAPLSITGLAEACRITVYEVARRVERLERHGIVMRCALTPTDIMHADGSFGEFDAEAAKQGVAIMALQLGLTPEKLCASVRRKVECGIYVNIVKKLLALDDPETYARGVLPQTERLIESAFYKHADGKTDAVVPAFTCPWPLVGLGAPIHIYLPQVAAALGCECVIDPDAGVANAIGAITGNVVVRESVTIRSEFSTMGIAAYHCAGSDAAARFTDYDEAVAWATEQARTAAEQGAQARGAVGVEIRVESSERKFSIAPKYLDDSPSETAPAEAAGQEGDPAADTLLETIITAVGTGRVNW